MGRYRLHGHENTRPLKAMATWTRWDSLPGCKPRSSCSQTTRRNKKSRDIGIRKLPDSQLPGLQPGPNIGAPQLTDRAPLSLPALSEISRTAEGTNEGKQTSFNT